MCDTYRAKSAKGVVVKDVRSAGNKHIIQIGINSMRYEVPSFLLLPLCDLPSHAHTINTTTACTLLYTPALMLLRTAFGAVLKS